MNIRLRGVKIIDPGSEYNGSVTDMIISDGKIHLQNLDEHPTDQTISYHGLCVSPGWFDMQATFHDPGHEYKEDLFSGAECAKDGGFTDVMLMPNTEPVVQSKNDIRYILSRLGQYPVALHASGAVTMNTEGSSLTEMLDMHEAGALAFTDGDKPLHNSDILLKTLQYLQKFGGVLMTRPSDKYLSLFGQMHEGKISTMLGMKGIPALAEEIVMRRDLQLLEYAGGKLHFSNLSTKGALNLLAEAKERGLNVTADVAVSQLAYTEEALLSFDTNYKSDPPFRSRSDRESIVEAVSTGLIDAVVSAHLPQDEESKKCEFDLASPGMIMLQTAFPMLLEALGHDKLEVMVNRLAYGPRNILGLAVPTIKDGTDACLTLFHPEHQWRFDATTNLSKSHNSPLLGKELKGKACGIINGRQVYIDQSILTYSHD